MDNQIFETNQNTGKFSLADFFARIYALVGMGIAVSAVVAFITLTMFADNISAILTGHTWLLFVLWILEMVLVVAVTPMAAKNSPMALPAFIGFSALNGFTLTFILISVALPLLLPLRLVCSSPFQSLVKRPNVTYQAWVKPCLQP